MPELPEVECVVRTLRPLIGKKVVEVTINERKLREKVTDDIKNNIGAKIIDVVRRSKYIIFYFDNNSYWIGHLGMTGKFVFRTNSEYIKHDHISIRLDDGSYLIYNDPRKFGMLLYSSDYKNNKYISKLGIEPLSKDFTDTYYFDHTNEQDMKHFLLNQEVVCGLGNIYVIEALHLAKINPQTISKKVSKEKFKELTKIVIDILTESIKRGGSSISDYRDANDEMGNFQSTFNVYGRDTCGTCGGEVLSYKKTKSARNTYYCPTCQP